MPAAGRSPQATLVPMNRALIVVDVQESFRARPEWSRMA
ncbi:isochorismatase, partial [Streptomyces sp. NRRL F-6602]